MKYSFIHHSTMQGYTLRGSKETKHQSVSDSEYIHSATDSKVAAIYKLSIKIKVVNSGYNCYGLSIKQNYNSYSQSASLIASLSIKKNHQI